MRKRKNGEGSIYKRKDGRIFPLHTGSKTRRTGKETGQKNRPEKNAKEVITNGNT